MKRCSKCGEDRPKSEFFRCASRKDGLQTRCKSCSKEIGRKHYAANRPLYTAYHRKARLKQYGTNQETVDSMLIQQASRCAICSKELGISSSTFAVDHNHTTGTVRGILCRPCNTGIGLLGDNPGTLIAASKYLVERGYYG